MADSIGPPPESLWTWTVPESSVGIRADRAIADALDGDEGEWSGENHPVSRSRLQKLMEDGRVLGDGKPLAGSAKLRIGTSVQIRLPEPVPLEVSAEDIPLEILFEDPHLIVVNKPPGLTVHPSSTQRSGTLVNALLFHVRDLSGIGGTLRPGIVHRIDKETSGALVVTKTDAAHLALAAVFARHEIDRKYAALCYGAPVWEKEHRFESRIGRNPQDRLKMTTEVKEGRQAISRFLCREKYGIPENSPFACFIEATLETGRTHQIRVHLTALGHSILGDAVYGSPSSNQPKWKHLPADVQDRVKTLSGQALHARVLGFQHPITGQALRFEADYPSKFQQLLDTLRNYA